MKNPYDDIINLPHHVSKTRPQMSRANRAAQFAPFAALTGYDAAVKETARLTDAKIELGESAIADLDVKLSMLTDMVADSPMLAVTHFRPDGKKDGGAYVTSVGTLKKIDDYERIIVLMTGEKIRIEDVLDIESELFENLV
ncbi:MAG: hypothetical protein LBU32_32115 [Clostridiales bacterium]|jgi:hypothetical protein|nr:hypothetical protein [Clostridiales bacterium]